MIVQASVLRVEDSYVVECKFLEYRKVHYAFDWALAEIDKLTEDHNIDYFEDDPEYITAVTWDWKDDISNGYT